MARKFQTLNPMTGDAREYTTEAPCTEMVLAMFDVAVQRLERTGISKEYMRKCYLEALVPSPKFTHDVIKDWLEGRITQEEAHRVARDELQKLVKSWREQDG